MRTITKYIPNTITCLNLFSGCVACVMISQEEFFLAGLWIILASLFDFMDGFVARMLKAFSPIGKELDSLADVVSFGVAPAFMIYMLFTSWMAEFDGFFAQYFPYLGFLVAVFSGLRLAKFNIDDRQTTSFIGLPVPANALFWCALIVGAREWLDTVPYNYLWLLPLVCFSSWMLVSEVPMFALKFKTFAWSQNKLRYSFLLLSILLIVLTGIPGISLAIILYVLLSLFNNRK
ncbi:MAG: CDP-diacylglycerol--serine O-phosphatidyltransferase [Bacteroidales bacterium]|jgi:CDP-diacylglycerol---serine O-phosphatidyltransferase|nr:CDP-diacylglycerol--serine O-phosphatidyltransferase [Bacteroidales bacterium]